MTEQPQTQTPQFYLTPEHPCSYLPGAKARTLFLDPAQVISPRLYGQLSGLGFRRSGSHLYRPQCNDCNACIPTRLPVAAFHPNRQQRRISKRNQDLVLQIEPPQYADEYYHLYASYISSRHGDGDMYPPTRDQYRGFLSGSWSDTRFFSLRAHGHLLAVAVTDSLPEGLSAIYTFFDPAAASRSLGVYAVLQQIQACRDAGLPYLYLGYWIKDCRKMAYKTQYRPIQLRTNNGWVQVN